MTGSPPIPLPTDVARLIGARWWRREVAGESGGAVFRLGGDGNGDLFLKYGEGDVATAIIDEAVRSRWLEGRLPVPRIRALVIEGERAWMLSEAVPGLSGDGWLERDPASLPRIIDAFASFLLQLHALNPADCPFRADMSVRLAEARRRVADKLVDTDDFDADHAG